MTDRKLSDEDVVAIVDALEVRLTDKFYRDIGKGFWGMAFKAIMGGLLFVAAYGALQTWPGGK
jgi:hypothetical protein